MDKRKKIDMLFTHLSKCNIPVDAQDSDIPIKTHLNDRQLYSIAIQLSNTLPKSNLEKITEFADTFKVDREESHVVEDFKYKELRFRLILEETLELGKAFGLKSGEQYLIYRELADKVEKSEIDVDIFNVADAYIDLLYVVYGGLDVANLSNIVDDLYAEVHRSNMSKVVSTQTVNFMKIIKDSVEKYKNNGVKVVSKDLKNGYYSINDLETTKILKPITYSTPDLVTIIEKHLNHE